MTIKEFISELKNALQGELPANEVKNHIEYYENYLMVQARVTSEETATSSLGNPQLIAKTLINDYRMTHPTAKIYKDYYSNQNSTNSYSQNNQNDYYSNQNSTNSYSTDSRYNQNDYYSNSNNSNDNYSSNSYSNNNYSSNNYSNSYYNSTNSYSNEYDNHKRHGIFSNLFKGNSLLAKVLGLLLPILIIFFVLFVGRMILRFILPIIFLVIIFVCVKRLLNK